MKATKMAEQVTAIEPALSRSGSRNGYGYQSVEGPRTIVYSSQTAGKINQVAAARMDDGGSGWGTGAADSTPDTSLSETGTDARSLVLVGASAVLVGAIVLFARRASLRRP